MQANARYSHNPVFDRAMLKARQRFGAKLFERKSNLRHLIRAIQQGKPCYYLPDQDPGPRRAVFASFFGISTATWPVLGRLSQLGRAKALTCATYMKPDGKGFEIVFGEPLKNFPSGDDETDTTTMNKVIVPYRGIQLTYSLQNDVRDAITSDQNQPLTGFESRKPRLIGSSKIARIGLLSVK